MGARSGWWHLGADRREFRSLFLAHAISRAGDAFNTVALVVLVFQLTGSALGVAGTVALEIAPILLLSPVIGLLVDRYPRRSLMIAADAIRAVLALLITFIGDSLWLAYGVAFGLSTFTQLFNPASNSTLPDVVEPEELVDANAALWTVAVLVQILLAPLAGLLIAAHGTGVAFALNAVSYLGSAVLLLNLQAGRSAARHATWNWDAATAGAKLVRSQPFLRRLALVQVLAALSAGATSGLLVMLAANRLDIGPTGIGGLLGAIGIGAALGPLVLGRFIQPTRRLWLFGPLAVRGAVDLVLALATSLPVALAALAVYGVGTSTGMVAYQATLQRELDRELRGRVFSLFDVMWNAARLVSLACGGLLADRLGVQAVYAAGGLLLLGASCIGWTGPVGASRRPGRSAG